MKTTAKDFKKIVMSILNQRAYLVKNKAGGKNEATCLEYIKTLKAQIEAYESKWDVNGWAAFVQRNEDKLNFLTPENKAGESTRLRIKQLIQNL